MRKAYLLLGPVLALVLLTSPVLAYDTAKSLGMAGATVAISDDLSSPCMNPAGLVNINRPVVGMSLSSKTTTWKDGTTITGSDTVPLDALGGAMPLGPGTIYGGLGTIRSEALDFSDADVTADTKFYAPGVAYAMKVIPDLSLGADLMYLYKTETGGGDADLTETATGIGANLGLLYTLGPAMNLGASLFLPGRMSMNGKDAGEKYTGYLDNPSTLKLGGAMKPMSNLTVAMQFDVESGFSFPWHYVYDSGSEYPDQMRGDSVIITRLGAEYALAVEGGTVPFWGGLALSPDNNFSSPNLIPWPYYGQYQYDIPSATTLALGTGYRTDKFDIGIAGQITSGTQKIVDVGETMNISDTKLLISGAVKI